MHWNQLTLHCLLIWRPKIQHGARLYGTDNNHFVFVTDVKMFYVFYLNKNAYFNVFCQRPTFFWRDTSILPCSKIATFYGNPLRAVGDDLLLHPVLSVILKMHNYRCPRSHFQPPTFKNITSVKFTAVLHRRTMSVVAKTWHINKKPPKPEIITFLATWQISSKFQRQIWDFRPWRARHQISQIIATTVDYQKLQDLRSKRLFCHFENRRFAVGIEILPDVVPEIYVFPVIAATLPFPVVGHRRNHLATLYSGSLWSKILDLTLEFRRYVL